MRRPWQGDAVPELDMDLVVPSHIAYCFTGDRPIFLDIARDRYFAVSERLGTAFGAVLREGRDARPPAEIDALVRHGLLAPSASGHVQRQPVVQALRQQDVRSRGAFALADAVGVAWAIWRARRRLGHEPFANTIARLEARWMEPWAIDADLTARLCTRFLRYRSLVPIPPVCLLDCLALLGFLEARGGRADLVFGVVASPFAAHCWLQLGDQVLNDRLERVAAFTPILVV